MKKLMLFILLINVVFCGFSQTDDSTNKKLLRNTEKILGVLTQQSGSARAASIRVTANEFGLDIFDLAILHTIDVTYEYVTYSEFGFGFTGRINLSDESNTLLDGERNSITPFVRYYFIGKADYGSKGFYVEAFLKCFGWREYYDYGGVFSNLKKEEDYLEAALGVGLGYKYVNRKGFVVNLNIGLGRSLGLSKRLEDTVVGRGGIILGYRF
ncbi:MAG: hypothetical protein FWD60_05500 [Candidatus Azobacteroides sp.]|nr:hypothetical protein [Candidatus Azobacteroides sp.]